MANTYVLISSFTASGGETSVTFSSIPSTYTDLVVRGSAREQTGTGTLQALRLQVNSDSTTIYSNTNLQGNGSGGAASNRSSNQSTTYMGNMDGAAATASTFSSIELYIPSYNSTANKPMSTFQVTEDNSSGGAQINCIANLYRNSSGITTLQFQPNGKAYASGSSFYLYGIKNS